MGFESRRQRLLHHGGLVAIVLAAAFLRVWRLEQNGFGTEY